MMNERLNDIIRHPATIPSVIGAVAFGSGLGLGYILGKRKSEVEVSTIPEQLKMDFDAAEVDHYIRERGRVVIDADAVNDDVVVEETVIETETVIEIDDEEDDDNSEDEAVRHSIFGAAIDGWDYAEEMGRRSDKEPYVLHRDEFFAEETDYSRSTLTYYEKDDILTDENDVPIYDQARLLGGFDFGHGSGDPNVFYVRNDARRGEYEVLLHKGSYNEEVLGAHFDEMGENELRHSSIRKLRPE